MNATLRESGRFVGLTKFPEGKKVTPVMVYETLIYDFAGCKSASGLMQRLRRRADMEMTVFIGLAQFWKFREPP